MLFPHISLENSQFPRRTFFMIVSPITTPLPDKSTPAHHKLATGWIITSPSHDVSARELQSRENVSFLLVSGQVTKRSSTGLLAAAFTAIVPSYISRSVGGSYDNEGVAIFALIFVFYLWIKSVNTGSMMWGCLTVSRKSPVRMRCNSKRKCFRERPGRSRHT